MHDGNTSAWSFLPGNILRTLGSENDFTYLKRSSNRTMSDYRMETPDKAILQFEERPSGQPEALKSWFYPGYNSGVEFVYPTSTDK